MDGGLTSTFLPVEEKKQKKEKMFASTKALLLRTDAFAGDFESTDLSSFEDLNPDFRAQNFDDDSNPFGDDENNPFGRDDDPFFAKDFSKDLPLLRATKDIMNRQEDVEEEDPDGAPIEIAALLREAKLASYPGIEFDRLMLDRAIASKDWPRAKVAALRLTRSNDNSRDRAGPPKDLLDLKESVNKSTVCTADDRRAFETSLLTADWTMASFIGTQIRDFAFSTTTTEEEEDENDRSPSLPPSRIVEV